MLLEEDDDWSAHMQTVNESNASQLLVTQPLLVAGLFFLALAGAFLVVA